MPKKTKTGGVAADQLRSILDRVEKLEEEKTALGADIRETMTRVHTYFATRFAQEPI